jgi:hypothetical protein
LPTKHLLFAILNQKHLLSTGIRGSLKPLSAESARLHPRLQPMVARSSSGIQRPADSITDLVPTDDFSSSVA